MKVEKLTTNSRNSEVNATTGLISNAFQDSSLTGNAELISIFGEIDPQNQQLTLAIKRMKAESDLEIKDEVRDTDHHALYHLVEGATYNTDPAVNIAAAQVFNVLEHHGLSVTDENYDTETSYLNAVLEDLAKPNLQDAIARVTGCADRIAILQTSQDAFVTARLAFKKERAMEGKNESATKIRKQLVLLINNELVEFLNGMLVRNSATFGDFAATVNQIIAENNSIVKKRSKVKSVGKTVVG